MARKNGSYEEFKERTSGGVPDEAKIIISAIVERVLIALNSSRIALSHLLTKNSSNPDKKLDSKIGYLINRHYSQIPWHGTIVELCQIIPSAEDPSRNLTPEELWGIFAGLREYPAEFINAESFKLSSEEFDKAVRNLAAKLERGELKPISDHVVDADPDMLRKMVLEEIRDRGITQADFARLVGISNANLSKMMNGDSDMLKRANFARLALHITNPQTGDPFQNADDLIDVCDSKV